MRGPKQSVALTATGTHSQGQGCSQFDQPTNASGSRAWLLGSARVLAAALILAALTLAARGQTSVTLAWDPSPSSGIAGYRLYQGTVSRTYTNVIAVGNATTKTVSNLVSGATYFFVVTAYSTRDWRVTSQARSVTRFPRQAVAPRAPR